MNEFSFSIALIARNEALHLPRLFASLQEYSASGGEIVIVDTGSEDDTVALAHSHGARVIEAGSRFHSTLSEQSAQEIKNAFSCGDETLSIEAGQQIFDFSQAREFATFQARHDFIFMPDAGDELLHFDCDWLNDQLKNSKAAGFRYWLQYGTGQLIQTRFYDRRLQEWRGRVHEALFERGGQAAAMLRADAPPIVDCEKEKLQLRHHKAAKARPYLAGLALDALAERENPRFQHYLGRELFYLQKWRSAIPLLLAHADNGAAWSAERNESLCLVGQCFEALRDDEAAVREYSRAHAIDGSRREPWLRLARLHSRRGEFEACAQACRAALKIRTRGMFTEADENFTHLPHSLLYWSLFWMGEREAAEVHWRNCLAFEPHNSKFSGDAKLFGADAAQLLNPPPIMLHILTRCSRPENILKVKDTVFRDAAGFEIIWHLLFDSAVLPKIDDELLAQLNQPNIRKSFHKGIPSDLMHNALNVALDQISDGWIYVLDDDNAMHENFYPSIRALISEQNCWGIVFSQRVDGRDFTGLNIREARPENMKIQKVDMAQWVLHRDLIAAHRFPLCDYAGDGVFIAEIYRERPEQFYFLDEVLCFYNALAE